MQESQPGKTDRSLLTRIGEGVRRVGQTLRERITPPPEVAQIGYERVALIERELRTAREALSEEVGENRSICDQLSQLATEAAQKRVADETGKRLEKAATTIGEAPDIRSTTSGRQKRERGGIITSRRRREGSITTAKPVTLATIVKEIGPEAADNYVREVNTEAVNTTASEVVGERYFDLEELTIDTQEALGRISTRGLNGAVTESITHQTRGKERVDDALTTGKWGKTNEVIRREWESEAKAAHKARQEVREIFRRAEEIIGSWLGGMARIHTETGLTVARELAGHRLQISDSSDSGPLQECLDKFAMVEEEVALGLRLDPALVDEIICDPEVTLNEEGRLVVAPKAAERVMSALQERLTPVENALRKQRLEDAVAVVNFQTSSREGDLRNPNDPEARANLIRIAEAVGLPVYEDWLDNEIKRRALVKALNHLIKLTGNRIFESFQVDSKVSVLAQQGCTFKLEDGVLVAIKDGVEVERILDPISMLNEPTLKSQRDRYEAEIRVLAEMWRGDERINISSDTVGARETWRRAMNEAQVRLESVGNPLEGVSEVAGNVWEIYYRQEQVLSTILEIGGEVPVMAVPASEAGRRRDTERLEKIRATIVRGVEHELERSASWIERYFTDRLRIAAMMTEIDRRIFAEVRAVHRETGDTDETLREKQEQWRREVRGIIFEVVRDYIDSRIRRQLQKVEL